MIGQVLLEGVGLAVLLVLICAIGIHKGAVGMVHLYHDDVQARCVELGLTTREKIRKNSLRFKLCCMPIYLAYLLLFVYAVNGARGFLEGFWQIHLQVHGAGRLCGAAWRRGDGKAPAHRHDLPL